MKIKWGGSLNALTPPLDTPVVVTSVCLRKISNVKSKDTVYECEIVLLFLLKIVLFFILIFYMVLESILCRCLLSVLVTCLLYFR